MSRRKKGKDDGGLSGDEWLATYSDTITLLLTFFILLYAISSVDKSKLRSVSSAMQQEFMGKGKSVLEYNLHNGDKAIVGDTSDDLDQNGEKITDEGSKAYEDAKNFVGENNLGDEVDIAHNEKGIELRIKDSILFDSGKAELIPNSKNVLGKLGNLLEKNKNNIIIEGHTDNLPINTFKYESNWELSSARAVNVVKYFTESKGLEGKRFCAAGYGENRPIVDNSTPDNRAKNRRVSIIILEGGKEK